MRCLLYCAALAVFLPQPQPQTVAFEVASVRPRSIDSTERLATSTRIGASQVHLEYVSLKDCIALAYSVSRDRIIGPDWLGTTRFDIAAKLPDGSARAQVPEMLQALLVSRFGLRLHRESRELPAYMLERVGELKITPTAPDPEAAEQPVETSTTGSSAGIMVHAGGGAAHSLVDLRFTARKVSMPVLAESLSSFVGQPVVDTTGTAGHFDVEVAVSLRDQRIMTLLFGLAAGVITPPPDADKFVNRVLEEGLSSLTDALRSVGLRLVTRRVPLEVLVVDVIERSPTEN